MNKKTLTTLFAEANYRIPDYQRGYAWEKKQWDDFIQDVDALVEEKEITTRHYAGTLVVYNDRKTRQSYGVKSFDVRDVVDGQQRLTTACLYLSIILKRLCEKGEKGFESEKQNFLYCGATCKLLLNNDTDNLYYDLLTSGMKQTLPYSPHQLRLIEAHRYLRDHIDKKSAVLGDATVSYLKDLFEAITQRLHFTFYEIEEECEIGMTFELMNSRGKGLSILELLKNYLMYWVFRNIDDGNERCTLTKFINKAWKDTYANLGLCSGNEDQCLRIAWTIYCDHSPSNWIGYDGFKGDNYIPLRKFSEKYSKAKIKDFIIIFVNGLAEVSNHYCSIISPNRSNAISDAEFLWLTKIHHTGNIANFLPLMVAARKHYLHNKIAEVDYIDLLKSLERFAYRVYLYESRRSNAGKSSFYRWSYEIFEDPNKISEVIALTHSLIRNYSPEDDFINWTATPNGWYQLRRLVKYTLFEYELYLLETEGHGCQPHLKWEQLNDSTIEHILPQTPSNGSHWKSVWTDTDFEKCVHDIGNLVLTQDNSKYYNFEFARKKGKAGISPSYSNSDIRQERKISKYSDWTREEFNQRRTELINWVTMRWNSEDRQSPALPNIVDEEDEDGIDPKVMGL